MLTLNFIVFNAIYSKSKGGNSELVTVELMKSYCLPFIMYATEAVPLSVSAGNMLDSCIKLLIRLYTEFFMWIGNT